MTLKMNMILLNSNHTYLKSKIAYGFDTDAAECLTVKVYQRRSPRRYSDEFLNFNAKTNICVGYSGDQDRCDSLLACLKPLPKPLYDVFRSCVEKNYPGGKLNNCTDSSNLFGTSEQFQSYFQCIINNIPEKSSLSSDEKKQFKQYKKCFYKVGNKCFKERGFKS
ncbi:uncharacterized protein TNCT_128101 [Trichonephila clavata]|uniref:Uncharacterized protein n=1 Tax=Trichonephila clavata TaxID=2740835 RepID=A0A8X6F3M8_TRICU|nr:uncharacterized protein TNCT_128101 [Trichonephila clavata]